VEAFFPNVLPVNRPQRFYALILLETQPGFPEAPITPSNPHITNVLSWKTEKNIFVALGAVFFSFIYMIPIIFL
jgi:hypothetical protein